MIKQLSYGFNYKPPFGCFGYSSCLLVEDDNKTILFDTGGYNLRSIIIPYIDKIDYVVISHLHFDHCSNLDLFVDKNIPIYISYEELKYYLKNKDKETDLYSYFNLIKDKLKIVEVDKEIYITSNTRIIFTKGHTPGHISLEINKNTILAGDAIKSYKDYINANEYGNAFNKKDYIKTKKELKNKYNTIYPGHSNKIVNGKYNNHFELKEF